MEYIGRLERDKKLLEPGKKIVIFGAGQDLDRLLNKLEEMSIRNRVVCICDNDPQKHGKEAGGLKIDKPETAFQHYADADYIIYNRFFIEICRQLQRANIDKVHLLRGIE